MSDMTRRQFLAITGSSLAGSSLALLGFSPGEALAEVREFKLLRAMTINRRQFLRLRCRRSGKGYSDGQRARFFRSTP